jgi:hypothetical protein
MARHDRLERRLRSFITPEKPLEQLAIAECRDTSSVKESPQMAFNCRTGLRHGCIPSGPNTLAP